MIRPVNRFDGIHRFDAVRHPGGVAEIDDILERQPPISARTTVRPPTPESNTLIGVRGKNPYACYPFRKGTPRYTAVSAHYSQPCYGSAKQAAEHDLPVAFSAAPWRCNAHAHAAPAAKDDRRAPARGNHFVAAAGVHLAHRRYCAASAPWPIR